MNPKKFTGLPAEVSPNRTAIIAMVDVNADRSHKTTLENALKAIGTLTRNRLAESTDSFVVYSSNSDTIQQISVPDALNIINELPSKDTIAEEDAIVVYSVADGAVRKVASTDFMKVMNDLDEGDIAQDDYLVFYDTSTGDGKKIAGSEIFQLLNGLVQLNATSIDSTVVVYDETNQEARKMTIKDMFNAMADAPANRSAARDTDRYLVFKGGEFRLVDPVNILTDQVISPEKMYSTNTHQPGRYLEVTEDVDGFPAFRYSIPQTQSGTPSIPDGSIGEPKLDITNNPSLGDVLQWNGSDMEWGGITSTGGTPTIANGSITNSKIADDTIEERKLKISNSPVNGRLLGYQNGEFEWVVPPTSTGGTPTISNGSITEEKLAISNTRQTGFVLQWSGNSMRWIDVRTIAPFWPKLAGLTSASNSTWSSTGINIPSNAVAVSIIASGASTTIGGFTTNIVFANSQFSSSTLTSHGATRTSGNTLVSSSTPGSRVGITATAVAFVHIARGSSREILVSSNVSSIALTVFLTF